MNDYCKTYEDCYNMYSSTLWQIILSNPIKTISLIAFDYYYYVFTGLLIFYTQKILIHSEPENTYVLLKILTKSIALSYYFLPVINIIKLLIDRRLFDLVLVRTVFFAQLVTIPLYIYAYSDDFKIRKKYKQFPYNMLIVLLILLIYTVLFIIYLFTFSEYVQYNN